MKVSAVVVTYNRLNLLKKCLKSLLNQNFKLDNIFVINNDSTDNTKKYLLNINDSTVHPVNMAKNLGGAGGFSTGIRIACEHSDSDFIWIMDDDAVPTKSALMNLVKVSKELHNNFGYLCSNVRWWKDMSPSIMNIPSPAQDWPAPKDNNLIKVQCASFVSLFFSKKIVYKIGLPIAPMFIWADDTDYTMRLSQQRSSYLVRDSIVLHESKTNNAVGSIVTAPLSRIKYFKCMFRNKLYISRKNLKFKDTMKLILSNLYNLVKIPFCAKTYKLKRMSAVITGTINGLFFNPKIEFPK